MTTKDTHIWGYGYGNLGFGVIFQIISSYFVFYATAVLGLPGTLVGTIVSIGLLWDALSDPIMGYLSDHTHLARWGKRHLYILVGGILTLVFNLLLWNLPLNLSTTSQALLLVTYLLGIKTALTIYGTPYTALGAEMSNNHGTQAKIQSIKMVFFILGIFIATAFCMVVFFKPSPHFPVGQLNPKGYMGMSLFTSVIMTTSMVVSLRATWTYRRGLENTTTKGQLGLLKFFKSLYTTLKHKDFRAIVLGYLFTNLASAILGAIGLHVYTYTFYFNNVTIAGLAGAQLGLALVSQPFWLWYIKRHDKKDGIRLGLVLSMIASLYFTACVLFRVQVKDAILLLSPFLVLGGIGTGGLITLPQAMVADTVDVNRIKTGRHQAGIYYGTLTLSYKLSQSLALVAIGLVLDLIGFNASLAHQSNFTALAMGLLLGLGSLVAFVLAFVSYKGYTLNRQAMCQLKMSSKL